MTPEETIRLECLKIASSHYDKIDYAFLLAADTLFDYIKKGIPFIEGRNTIVKE